MVRCLTRFHIFPLTNSDIHDVYSSEEGEEEQDEEEEYYDTEFEEFEDLCRLYSRKYGYADPNSSAEYEDEDTENAGDDENEDSLSDSDSEGEGDSSEGSEDESDSEDSDSVTLSATTDDEEEDACQSESGYEEGDATPHFGDCTTKVAPSPDLSGIENECVSHYIFSAFTEYSYGLSQYPGQYHSLENTERYRRHVQYEHNTSTDVVSSHIRESAIPCRSCRCHLPY